MQTLISKLSRHKSVFEKNDEQYQHQLTFILQVALLKGVMRQAISNTVLASLIW